jgi:hypothetical protein
VETRIGTPASRTIVAGIIAARPFAARLASRLIANIVARLADRLISRLSWSCVVANFVTNFAALGPFATAASTTAASAEIAPGRPAVASRL